MLTDAQRTKYEKLIIGAFSGPMKDMADPLIAALGNPPDVANIPAALWNQLDGRLRASLELVMVEMAVTSATSLGASAGISDRVNWKAVNQRAARWAERYTFALVRGVDTVTRDMLQGEISRYFRDNKIDLKTLAGQIEPSIKPLTDALNRTLTSATRAELIATTEVTRASAQGEQALVDQIRQDSPGALIVQIWLTSNDELVCPQCGPLHGKRRGEGWTDPPPKHPRCRCAMGTQIAALARS